MVNFNPQPQFGTNLNAVDCGRKGGKSTTIKTVFARELKKIQSLDAKDHLQKTEVIDKNGNKVDIYTVLLAGEDGIDCTIKSILGIYLTKLDRMVQNTKDDYEQVRLIKECIKAVCKVKEVLYGKKVRAPEGPNIFEIQKATKLFEELEKDDGN
ncbi:MAG: hypothetical protein PHH82_02725 [Candidatus ainarchaeum sp.]|nr:hypothetical protein [Candidatus ainarchaeum sp.]